MCEDDDINASQTTEGMCRDDYMSMASAKNSARNEKSEHYISEA
jgi:hypothetical protein